MRIKRFIAGVIATIAFSGAMAQNVTIDSSPKGYLQRGILMYEGENYNGAIDQLSFAVEQPLSASEKEQADFYIANSYYHKGETGKALALLNAFVKNYPVSVYSSEVQATIGDLYFANGDYPAAVQSYKRVNRDALALSRKNDVTYRLAYSELRLKSGDVVNGIELSESDLDEYRRQAQALFNSIAGTNRYYGADKFYSAYLDYEKGDYGYAFDKFAEIDKNSELGYVAQYYMCQIHYLKAEYDAAVSLGKKLLSGRNYSGMNTEISRVAGESYFRNNDDDNALKYMEQYFSEEEKTVLTAKYVMGVLCYRNSDFDKAISMLSEVSEEDDVLGQSAYYHLGQVYRRKGDMTMASIAFEKAASMTYSKETQESAYYNYATAQVNGARTPSGNAIEMFENFLNRFPNSRYTSDVSSYLVALYVNGSDYKKALASINRIKNPAKNVVEAKQIVLYNLGINALSGDKVAEAEKYLLQARELAKYNRSLDAQVSLWLGECAYRKGDYTTAAKYQNEYLKAVKSTDSNYGIGYYNLGYTRFQQQKYSDARNAFNKAISSKKLNESNANDANNRIGDTYYYSGQFKTAQKYYEKSAGDYAVYQKAMMLGYSKDYSGKIEQLKSLVAKYPSSSLVPVAMLEMGDAYVNLNENKKAVNVYNELIGSYPNNQYARKAMLSMAIVERNSKNEASAIAAYQDVIRKYPSSEEASVALEDLKLIYAERGELNKLRDFVATIENAPELDVNEMDRLAFEAAEKSYIENNDNIDKMKDYLSAYPDGAFSLNAKYYIAKYHFGKGENDEALALIEEVESNNSNVSFVEDLMAMKASILVAQSKHEKAIATFKALEDKASNSDNRLIARLGVMRSAVKIDNYAVMEAYADKLLNGSGLSAGEEKEAAFCRAYARYQQGNSEVASKEFAELAKNGNSIYGAQASFYLAELQFGENRLNEAENTLNTFIDSGTEHNYWLARAFILLADIYHKQGKTFEAREYLESLKGSYPGEADGIMEMIDSRLKKWSSTKTKKK